MSEHSSKIGKTIFDKEFFPIGQKVNKSVYGYMINTLPDHLIKGFDQIITDLLNNKGEYVKYNNELAGEIEDEYGVEYPEGFKEYFIDLLRYYEVKSNGFIKKALGSIPIVDLRNFLQSNYGKKAKKVSPLHRLPEFHFDQLWVNLQKKHEFNPPHTHAGLISFVVWHKIPFKKEDEKLSPSAKDKDDRCQAGDFSFLTTNSFGEIGTISIDADNKFEGNICIFPSDLTHMVNPFFTSDEYRITFSSNVFFADSKSLLKKFK